MPDLAALLAVRADAVGVEVGAQVAVAGVGVRQDAGVSKSAATSFLLFAWVGSARLGHPPPRFSACRAGPTPWDWSSRRDPHPRRTVVRWEG